MGRPGHGLSHIGNDVKPVIFPVNHLRGSIKMPVYRQGQVEDRFEIGHRGWKGKQVRENRRIIIQFSLT